MFWNIFKRFWKKKKNYIRTLKRFPFSFRPSFTNIHSYIHTTKWAQNSTPWRNCLALGPNWEKKNPFFSTKSLFEPWKGLPKNFKIIWQVLLNFQEIFSIFQKILKFLKIISASKLTFYFLFSYSLIFSILTCTRKSYLEIQRYRKISL